ncbi:MAG: aconitate hydratase AcnA [Pseudomonadota bacterium]
MDRESFRRQISVNGQTYSFYEIRGLEREGLAEIGRLPFAVRILTENLLRKLDSKTVTEEHVLNVARWRTSYENPVDIPYHPARVLMQDFTGIPAVVDLASMREAFSRIGGDPRKVNPQVPVELIIDHSVQVDYFGCTQAAELNLKIEFERNAERYSLLKWARNSFDDFKVVPPGVGICHQVNLEYLGRVVMTGRDRGGPVAYPDTVVGLDSHTTMINGLGVMGWGVGGIEAEAVMLGQPYGMVIPEVIGIRLTGGLRPGVTATDLVLTVTEMLRKYNVVGKFVEFTGAGVKDISVPDRAVVANMTPEFGATLTLFPVDERTIEYLRNTNRSSRADLAETYCRANDLFCTGGEEPEYSDVLELDLADVVPCVAGPSRPQDRIAITDVRKAWEEACIGTRDSVAPIEIDINGVPTRLSHGSTVIGAITSCTNTSNPHLLIGAGLLAKNAVKVGLKVPPYVKTSFAPGSPVVPRYLENAGLMPYLEALGFHVAGYGCTTCIGNSGPLHQSVENAIVDNNLNTSAILSGNRNFEARVHQLVRSNFLASPMLVVAYTLAGRIDIDLTTEPLGFDPNGTPVHLDQLWPSEAEIRDLVERHVASSLFEEGYAHPYEGDETWRRLEGGQSVIFNWDPQSTYIKNPPYFDGFSRDLQPPSELNGARVLALLGDSVTTDHISPAGAIPRDYPAGRYLIEHGVEPERFNSYGSRRGNHEVMMRGTFGNVRLRNRLAEGRTGGYSRKLPEGRGAFIYDAAMEYASEGRQLIVIGGKEYGTGSSRDWAAKGTRLLGVGVVIARSYERIHRSNLVCMGVMPLEFRRGEDAESLGLDGTESYFTSGIDRMRPGKDISVRAVKEDGPEIGFTCRARLDTEVEVEYFLHGGILPYVLRKMSADTE